MFDDNNNDYNSSNEGHSSAKLTGKVKWFNKDKGYGFIVPDDKTNDVFVHINNLSKSSPAIDSLYENDLVKYNVEVGRNDKISAVNIEVVESAPRTFNSSSRSNNRSFNRSY